MKKMIYSKKLWFITFNLLFLLCCLGCPRRRSCVDVIIPPRCVRIGVALNVSCCHMGALYDCDLYIYQNALGMSGYREPMFGIPGCVGPLGRCREVGPYTCR